MANPAPTINQINAFNATQGTIIDFNIIGGTELVRSNRIYIYDLSDNSLICTHLYVSTESIHELPANTDSSIVYESGKSSADFVNGAQYYIQIQTYTDTAGTEGGSGLSVAKMFWCLVDPILTITTIPSTISTTSYNVSATYDANTSVVSNIIQQYQFSLYSAIGSLLQSSGVIVGSGAQQGTSTTYDISYNFTGLSVGSSYYVVVDVTSTQGMDISAQSITFTVSIDTPTLGEATVVNNACDGYISVISNLSGEYGGSASGEIASFVTNSINNVSSLKVNLEPIQDGTPWNATTADVTPYNFRKVPSVGHSINSEYDNIVGGTVAWNQLVQNGNFAEASGWGSQNGTLSIANNKATVSKSGASNEYLTLYLGSSAQFNVYANHRYLLNANIKSANRIAVYPTGGASGGGMYYSDAGVYANGKDINFLWIPSNDVTVLMQIRCYTGTNVTADLSMEVQNVTVTDLTALFGNSAIADYVYSLEQATAGAGVAWLKEHFPKMFNSGYMSYDAGTLKSVEGLQSHDTVGFNVWDEEYEAGGINATSGQNETYSGRYRSTNYIPILPNTTYYHNVAMCIFYYDADKNYVGQIAGGFLTARTFVTLNNAHYMRFMTIGQLTDICINFSKTTGTPMNGDYVPYQKHTYALDSDLVLRGIPVLDANNNFYYDGDTCASDGTVTRRYGIVDLGTLNWTRYASEEAFYCSIAGLERSGGYVVCDGYVRHWVSVSNIGNLEFTGASGADETLWFKNTAYTDSASFKASMSGKYLVYKLKTPTTETADPYTNPQVVDPDGTEEYVTTSIIPVGHETYYADIYPISGYDEVNVTIRGKNLFDPTSVTVNNSTLDGDTFTTNFINSAYYASKSRVFSAGTYTVSITSDNCYFTMYIERENGTRLFQRALTTSSLDRKFFTFTAEEDFVIRWGGSVPYGTYTYKIQLESGSTATDYEPYGNETYTAEFENTVYGGEVDLVSGVLTVDRAMVDLGTATWYYVSAQDCFYTYKVREYTKQSPNLVCSNYPYVGIYADLVDKSCGYIYGNAICIRDSSFNQDASAFKTAMNGVQLCYELATPQEIQLTPQQIQTLVGENYVLSDAGDVEVTYNIPITNLIVKRQDVADVSGTWLTLYSQPITQASDMDFTFIDFLNQYGKTYKYALVPLLTQTQSGVEVEVEGGYTVSDEVQSIFDGVFIADQTGLQKCKANVGYGDVDMNQAVGTITPIGAKYPVVITNSKNQYHNGSISGTIVPDDYYFNGNLSRIDMVNKRNELEQFLTNKRAKIIKDWNSNIWLVMIMDNITCSFNNDYGMGIVDFSANWIEVGDPTNQQDLQATGLIDVGGV